VLRQITPGSFECTQPVPLDGIPPGFPGNPLHALNMRPCGTRFQVPTTRATEPCFCGRDSIGSCQDCGRRLCGLHGTDSGAFLCGDCQGRRRAAKREREAQITAEREAGLINFRALVPDGPADPNSPPVDDPATETFRLPQIWAAVSAALLTASPPSDRMILDDHRLEELPLRWPPTHNRQRKQQRELARWEDAVDRLAIPAWDMEATFRRGGGVADTYSITEYAMYFGANGVLYCGPRRPTAAGTFAEWEVSYHSADTVPGAWRPEWGVGDPYYGDREVAKGFASLVARHDLQVDLRGPLE
jgi:hypothetical protein